MAGQVFYRKWRPQRFSDVVGQEYVTQTLLNALSTGRVAHAYLLCGPRGTGKTSTGRIMAKALNCIRNGKDEPCNECNTCLAITEGRALDLIEIDAASNRGIDEIRSLREKVNFAPNESRYKVYIIDEVHMLTDPAFNALLKTLEEPPPNTVFILATTEADKLPATVISRCQRFDFRRISLKDVAERLARLCTDEQIVAAPEVLMAVAKSAGGSLRDAENIFEQLVVGYGHKLEMAQLRDFLGLGGEQHVRALAVAAATGDIPTGLKVIGEAAAEGLDLRQFHRQVMEYLRALMLVKAGVDEGSEQLADAKAEVQAAAAKTTMAQVLRAVKAFGRVDLRSNSYNALPLELALVEAAVVPQAPAAPSHIVVPAAMVRRPPDVPAAKPVEDRRPPEAIRPLVPQPPVAPSAPPAAVARMEQAPPSVREAPPPAASRVPPRAAEPPQPPIAPPPPSKVVADTHATTNGKGSGGQLALLVDNWKSVIEASKVPGQKWKIDAILRSGKAVSVDDEGVVLAFPSDYVADKMKEVLDNPGSRRIVEEAFAKLLGQRRPVRCIVQPKEKAGGHLLKAAMEMGAKKVEEKPS